LGDGGWSKRTAETPIPAQSALEIPVLVGVRHPDVNELIEVSGNAGSPGLRGFVGMRLSRRTGKATWISYPERPLHAEGGRAFANAGERCETEGE